MKILVLGNGAREHSLCYAISRSPLTTSLFCIPGNYGISLLAECKDLELNNFNSIHSYCVEKSIDLIVVGPEVPLVAGIVDYFVSKNIKIFGPNKYASQLEGSKSFMKDLCKNYSIPTAAYSTFDNYEDAVKYLKKQSLPIVVKANGLAAGKGVTVADSFEMAEKALKEIFENKFGINMTAVIEEFMEGEEASYFVCTDGTEFISLESAQDHKRIGENDTGPNTGGMGAYSPAPIFTDEIKKQVDDEIIYPTLNAMRELGHPYQGILYAGLMIKNGKAKLVEYNIRFGDPECQVLMLRMKSDIVQLMLSCIDKDLHNFELKWEDDHCATVVMASNGYPGSFEKETIINGIDKLENTDTFQVFHAATAIKDKKIIAIGGRVLSVTSKNASLSEALKKIYESIHSIDWPEGYYRKDIGKKALT